MPDNKPIRVGLLGCGTYGRETQLPNILATSDLKLSALANRTAHPLKQATEIAKKAGCENINTYDDLHKLIDDQNVDAIISALPPEFNLPILEHCEILDKPVLLEKPLSTNDEDLSKIEIIVERRKIHVQVGMQLLFSDWFTTFYEQVANLGQLLSLNEQVYLFDDWAFQPMTWKVDAQTSGGMLNSWGVHPLTMLLCLAADRNADYADLAAFTGSAFAREHADPAMYDTLSAAWLTTGGETDIPCQLQICLHPDVKDLSWRLEAVTTEGRVVGDLFARTITVTPRGEKPNQIELPPHQDPGFDGNQQQLQFFANSIQNNQLDDSTFQLAVTACLMAYEINVNPTVDDDD